MGNGALGVPRLTNGMRAWALNRLIGPKTLPRLYKFIEANLNIKLIVGMGMGWTSDDRED